MKSLFAQVRADPKYQMVDEQQWFHNHKRLRDTTNRDRDPQPQKRKKILNSLSGTIAELAIEDSAKNAAIIQQLSQILKGIKNKKEEEEKIPLTNLNKQKTHKDLRFWTNSEGNLMISTSGEQRDFNPSISLINEVFSFNCLVGQTPRHRGIQKGANTGFFHVSEVSGVSFPTHPSSS